MTLVVEDGSIVSSANSYVTIAEFRSYADAREITPPTTDEGVEAILIKAMDYLESLDYKGLKVQKTQPLQWPRSWVTVDGYAVEATEIPLALKNAQMATANEINNGYGPLDPVTRAVKRSKVDVIETEYMDNAANKTLTPAITAQLRKLLKYSGSGLVRA